MVGTPLPATHDGIISPDEKARPIVLKLHGTMGGKRIEARLRL